MWFALPLTQNIVSWLVLAIAYFSWDWRPAQPLDMLQSLVPSKDPDIGFASTFNDLPTEYFHRVHGEACINDEPNPDQVLNDLRKTLNGGEGQPDYVLERVLKRLIFAEKDIASKLGPETVADMETHGKSTAVFAWWAINYDHVMSTYSVCLAFSGLEFRTAEVVAGYDDEILEEIIGYEPCHCGFVTCEQCPLKSKRTIRRARFKRHVLTFEEQERLSDHLERTLIHHVESFRNQPRLPYIQQGISKVAKKGLQQFQRLLP